MSGIWILIPAKGFALGKSRLSPVLDARQREKFGRTCFVHVVRTARRVVPGRQVVVASRDATVLGLARRLGVRTLRESGQGLNQALSEARDFALQRGAGAILVMHADLPAIEVSDIRTLTRVLARRQGMVIAPDTARDGSNALGVRAAGKIRFHFGVGSFAKHCAEARTRRLSLRVKHHANLGLDIDTPEAYRAWLQRRL